jgi:hypothetical protein
MTNVKLIFILTNLLIILSQLAREEPTEMVFGKSGLSRTMNYLFAWFLSNLTTNYRYIFIDIFVILL